MPTRPTIRAVLFDLGGTLEEVYFDDALRLQATQGFRDLLAQHGLDPGLPLADLYATLKAGMEQCQVWREASEREVPPERVWSEFVFTDHILPPEKLAAIGEELAFYWDAHFARRTLRPQVPTLLPMLRARGLRLGIIAGSDRHDYAVDERFHPIDIYPRGLTAVWAEELTPESLWRALWNRRVYGTTGARMVLEFFADGLPMGTEYHCAGTPRLHGRVLGTCGLRAVELLRHDERGYSVAWSGSRGAEAFFDLQDGDLRGSGFYYLRAEQEDGHCAWSSPIWIVRPGSRS